jgi:hypothetical protein
MPPKPKPPIRVKRGPGGGKLSKKEIEKIIQTYAVEGNYSETARKCGVTITTVRRHVKNSLKEDVDPRIREVRSRTMENLAARFVGKGAEALNAATPEKMDRASLSQLGIFAGIAADKARTLMEFNRQMNSDHELGRLPMPDTFDALASKIRGELVSIKALQVDFRQQAPDLAKKAEEVLAEAELVEAINAETEVKLGDLDGNT